MTTETPAGRFVRRRPTCLAMRVSEHNLADVAAWCGGHTWATSVIVPTMSLVDGLWRCPALNAKKWSGACARRACRPERAADCCRPKTGGAAT